MKSSKQRRLEIKEKRRKRAAKLNIDTSIESKPLPLSAVEADYNELIHNNTYGSFPLFYIDKIFTCRDCGSDELWTAKQQKWWYEVAKGHIDSTAVRCRKCRDKIKAEKDEQKKHMEEVANKMPHPNEAFFKNTK
ncbi:MAG: zinc-ribbon domain-containing protein [Amphritea sp.]